MENTSNSNIVDLDNEPVSAPKKPGRPAKAVEESAIAVAKSEGLSGEMVRVVINEGTDDLGREPVDVGLNGKVWRIKRNEEVTIPVEVFSIIENAVQVSYQHGKDGIEERNVHRYSFQVKRA